MSEGVFYRPPAAGVYDSSAGGLGTSPTWLSPMEGGKGEPPGVIHMYCGTTAPGGYLFCDGSQVDRKTYKRLFTLFGTSFGVGDNSTTFNLPDLRGRIPVGVGPNGDVSVVGMNDGLAPASRSPKHNHAIIDPGHVHNVTYYRETNSPGPVAPSTTTAIGADGGSPTSSATTGITVGPGGSRPTDTPAFLAVTYIIKT